MKYQAKSKMLPYHVTNHKFFILVMYYKSGGEWWIKDIVNLITVFWKTPIFKSKQWMTK